jgi:hypothetical protein
MRAREINAKTRRPKTVDGCTVEDLGRFTFS